MDGWTLKPRTVLCALLAIVILGGGGIWAINNGDQLRKRGAPLRPEFMPSLSPEDFLHLDDVYEHLEDLSTYAGPWTHEQDVDIAWLAAGMQNPELPWTSRRFMIVWSGEILEHELTEWQRDQLLFSLAVVLHGDQNPHAKWIAHRIVTDLGLDTVDDWTARSWADGVARVLNDDFRPVRREKE